MSRLLIPMAAAVLSWPIADPAGAQTRSLFDQPEAQDVPAAPASRPQVRPEAKRDPQTAVMQQQDEFIQRIQRSDKRATASICANGCRGEIGGRTQNRDPFAPLPDYDSDQVPSGYSIDP